MTTPTIDLPEFLRAYDEGALVIDIREPWEYVAGHVPGAVPLPMSRIGAYLDQIPTDRDVYVICQTGNRSRAITDLLVARHHTAYSVNGGTSAWSAAGRPVTTGTSR